MLSVVSELLASVPSEHSHPLLKLPLKSTLSLRVLTSTLPSPVLVSRSCAKISSEAPSSQSRKSFVTRRLTRPMSTKSSWSVVPPVFPVLSSSSRTSSTARSPTRASTPMRLLPMVLLSRLPFFPEIPPRRPRTCSCLTFHPSHWVSRLRVVS